MVDLHKPLTWGTIIRTEDGNLKNVFFKYERLFDFCYICGKLGLLIKDCFMMWSMSLVIIIVGLTLMIMLYSGTELGGGPVEATAPQKNM